jgi:hypothetical protein
VDWNGQHFEVFVDYSAFGRCAAVFWTTVFLSVVIASLVLCGVRRKRCASLLVMQFLLGISLLAAAWHPIFEYFGPAWRATNDHDRIDAILSRSVSVQCFFSYAVCASGLVLLIYFVTTKDRPLSRLVLVFSVTQVMVTASSLFWS